MAEIIGEARLAKCPLDLLFESTRNAYFKLTVNEKKRAKSGRRPPHVSYRSVEGGGTDVALCAVDADEIRRLGKRFRKLDLDNSGALSIDEFMSLPELQQNPLVQRVIDIFDADGNGEVSFLWVCSFFSKHIFIHVG